MALWRGSKPDRVYLKGNGINRKRIDIDNCAKCNLVEWILQKAILEYIYACMYISVAFDVLNEELLLEVKV